MSRHKDPIRIEIVIDRASARRLLIVGGIIAVLASAGAVLAVPKTYQDGDTLTAADLNQNFSNLEARVMTIETFKSRATQAGKYSVGAAYCGSTTVTPGDLSGISGTGSGYVKAKAACEAVTVCSVTAHVCTEEEIYRSVSTGNAPPDGWIMANLGVTASGGYKSTGCNAFTTNSSSYNGWFWSSSLGSFSPLSCQSGTPLLCCD